MAFYFVLVSDTPGEWSILYGSSSKQAVVNYAKAESKEGRHMMIVKEIKTMGY